MPLPFPVSAGEGVSPALLQRLEWRLRQAMETTLTGDYRSVFRGRGMEFDQVVKYQWGDDLRDIDWNVTARLGEPYRKKFVEERDVCVLLVFEDTPALQFGSAGRTRRDTLLEVAALLLMIGLLQSDRVGVIYTSSQTTWLRRPMAGREAALHTASLLLGESAPPLDGPAEVEQPWRLALRAAPRHSVLVWLGAFDPTAEHEDWRALGKRYQVMGFRADDPWDTALPANAKLPVFDPVAGRVTELNTGSTVNRAAHAAWAAAREDYFAGLFPEERTRQIVGTDAPVFESLLEFFHRRAQALARPR
jgi:hypothetical protein